MIVECYYVGYWLLGGKVQVIRILPGLRQGSVVPDVAVAGEGVGHEPEPSASFVEILESTRGP